MEGTGGRQIQREVGDEKKKRGVKKKGRLRNRNQRWRREKGRDGQ